MTDAVTTPSSAATVVVLREPKGGSDAFELLLLRRDASLAFLAGSYVFPGGVVEEDDRAEALAPGIEADPEASRFPHLDAAGEGVLRVAAARELLEEASILLARRTSGWAATGDAHAVLADLASGSTFGAALAARDLTPALDALIPFGHFLTPRTEPRRFDTCFFLTMLPPGQRADVVAGESDDHAWVTPARAIVAGTTGGLRVPPPTLVTLAQLHGHASAASALAWARGRRIAFVEPRVEVVDGARTVTIPDETLLAPKHPWWRPGGPRFVASADRHWRPMPAGPPAAETTPTWAPG